MIPRSGWVPQTTWALLLLAAALLTIFMTAMARAGASRVSSQCFVHHHPRPPLKPLASLARRHLTMAHDGGGGARAGTAQAAHGPGYDLLRKLGNPRWIAAPMVQQSDLAFRTLVRRYGTLLVGDCISLLNPG